MKKLIYLFLLSLFLPFGLLAQNWETNIDTALAKASEENKEIVLVFSGLDWCVPCVKMDRNIWQTEAFKTYASENWILLKADFPKGRRDLKKSAQMNHNQNLKTKYNPKGLFPKVVLLDKNGMELGHTLYKNIAPSQYIELLNKMIVKK